jgi:hypothetical protein
MVVLDVSDKCYIFEALNLHTQANGSWYAHPEETLLAPYCVFCILAVALLGKCCHSTGPLPVLTTTNACQCHSNNHPKDCPLNHETLTTSTLLLDIGVVEDESRAELVFLPVHLTPNNAKQRFAVN